MTSEKRTVPFNKPYMTGRELHYIAQAHQNLHLSADGPFTKMCNAWLESRVGCCSALLTHSCTAALEITAILAEIDPGDEVIMPSYTFVSTANAFVLRGAVPVFVDIRPDTLNLDETLVEDAITSRTKAIVPVHYAGVSCEMDALMDIAARHGLLVIEDAAQGVLSTYKGRPLGSIGQLSAVSFHETKNITSGEGGALLINEPAFVDRAEIIREKGTDRSRFFRGQVDKYTWRDVGSSYPPNELSAAFLWAQMEQADEITRRRLQVWDAYHERLERLEEEGLIRRPVVSDGCTHNAHMYYVLTSGRSQRALLIDELAKSSVSAVFHYVPLHSSPGGLKFGRAHGDLPNTVDASERIVRLPLWLGMDEHVPYVVETLESAVRQLQTETV